MHDSRKKFDFKKQLCRQAVSFQQDITVLMVGWSKTIQLCAQLQFYMWF